MGCGTLTECSGRVITRRSLKLGLFFTFRRFLLMKCIRFINVQLTDNYITNMVV